MPNSKSAEKRVRQNARRTATNRVVRSRIRTFTNKFEQALAAGEVAAAEAAYVEIEKVLDRAAAKGVIPKLRASRRKGRLAKRLAEQRG